MHATNKRGKTGVGVVLALVFGTTCLATQGMAAEAERPRPLFLAHYMSWFESKPMSGAWGWHWTMNHFDPERTDTAGRREIASHYYPLIGPYDSADRDVLEYHTLLLRIAGFDGAIADWYGTEDFNDYGMIHRRTSALFKALKQRGLRFAVCYEDRVLKAMAQRDHLSPEQTIAHAKTHLRFCEANWFNDRSYVTEDGKPVLLVFGPDYLNPSQWETVLAGIRPVPAFYTLHERRRPAIGSFAWPPMWASKDGVLNANGLDEYLDQFSKQDGLKIGCAIPGFHDIYKEAGAQPSHGYLDAHKGETFRHTLDRATASGAPIIQVATWNDFGEGTCVEPSREYGYRYLEMSQDARRRFADPFPFRATDLRLPLRIYQLRKQAAPLSPERKDLDEVVNRLFAADSLGASHRIDELEKRVPPPTLRQE
jgi:hypothetical protein